MLNHPPKGFTLIEVLVVIAIFLIIGVLAAPGFRYFQYRTSLDNDAARVINVLRLAQNKTLAAEKDNNYGVHLENKKYVLFAGALYSPTSASNINYDLAAETEFYEINLNGGGNNIVFSRVSGATDQYGVIKLRLFNSPNQTKTISVSSSGQIISGIPSTPANSTLIDTRHIHFNYNKAIKTASILKLTFPDDSFSYDINFQNYLNAAQDHFLWEGAVAVGGQNQKLKIHTHGLTDTSAIFSITRDRRYNNKALQILLDGDNLINYSADGAASQGASAFVGAPENQ